MHERMRHMHEAMRHVFPPVTLITCVRVRVCVRDPVHVPVCVAGAAGGEAGAVCWLQGYGAAQDVSRTARRAHDLDAHRPEENARHTSDWLNC